MLTYPKFKLDAAERGELLADFLPYSEVVRLPETRQSRPECGDPADWIFLELAETAGASVLVSGDSDLLCLRGKASVTILTAEEFKTRLLSGSEQGP